MTTDTFATRLAQPNASTKADIDDMVEKTYFDDKLKKLNEKVTSKKAKHVEAEKD